VYRNTSNASLFNNYPLANHLRRDKNPVTVHEKVREWTTQERTKFEPLHGIGGARKLIPEEIL